MINAYINYTVVTYSDKFSRQLLNSDINMHHRTLIEGPHRIQISSFEFNFWIKVAIKFLISGLPDDATIADKIYETMSRT